MSDGPLGYEALARGGAALGVIAVFVALEAAFPARARLFSRLRRWGTNAALAILSAALTRAAFPLAAAGVALWAQTAGVGLFNVIAAPFWLAAAASWLVLDLALYAQHRAMHAVPWLWRLHAAHHLDPELDVSTGLRFHPLEALVSLSWKACVAAALGAPAAVVIAFEIVLNAFSVFTHANLALPSWLERIVRRALITPAIHRIHHDAAASRAPPNYGFSLALWDQLFRTWRSGREPVALGVGGVPAETGVRLWPTLVTALRPPR